MRYFKIEEFSKSETAAKYGIDNTIPPTLRSNIDELVYNLLDKLREAWSVECGKKGYGSPSIVVSSGYRCKELNEKVGGKPTSAHTTGRAADLVPANGKIRKFIAFTKLWCKDKIFDQCIGEYGKWVHLAYKSNDGKQRRMIFDIK